MEGIKIATLAKYKDNVKSSCQVDLVRSLNKIDHFANQLTRPYRTIPLKNVVLTADKMSMNYVSFMNKPAAFRLIHAQIDQRSMY